MLTKKLLTAAAVAAFAVGSAGGVGVAQAKHGSDDPPRHDARDDHGARHHAHAARHRRHAEARHHHRHGGDDRPGDDHGGDR